MQDFLATDRQVVKRLCENGSSSPSLSLSLSAKILPVGYTKCKKQSRVYRITRECDKGDNPRLYGKIGQNYCGG